MNSSPLTIGFIGFGLIGGSIAKALKAVHPEYKIVVTSRSLAPLQEAKEDGIVDVVTDSLEPHFNQCDFIFLCTPVVTITGYFEQLKYIIKEGCIITDVGSVKGTVHNAAEAIGLSHSFIGGHPMAGSELSGYANSSAKLLSGAKYVITKTADTTEAKLHAYEALVTDMGAVPIVMDCELHDKTVAGISHLPHLAAAALTKVVKDRDDDHNFMHQLAAGGFKDTTRIAASSPEMWSQICQTNGEAICEMLDNYIAQLSDIRNQIAHATNPNTEYIKNLFAETREYRNTF